MCVSRLDCLSRYPDAVTVSLWTEADELMGEEAAMKSRQWCSDTGTEPDMAVDVQSAIKVQKSVAIEN
jgi:hypothetical protein